MDNFIIMYLLQLATTLILPTSLFILSTWRLARRRNITQDNYQEIVRETLENNIIERMSERLETLFPQYGPVGSAHTSNKLATY